MEERNTEAIQIPLPVIETVEVQLEELNDKNIFKTVTRHVKHLLLIKPINIYGDKITVLHFLFLAVTYSFFCYLYFLIKLILQLKAGALIKNIMFPTFPIFGCVVIILLSFITGRIYNEYLNDFSFQNYYIILLGGGYLPIIIILSNLIPNLKVVLYLCGAVVSEYFIRESLLKEKFFDDSNDRFYFLTFSMVINVGLYVGIFPEFFNDL